MRLSARHQKQSEHEMQEVCQGLHLLDDDRIQAVVILHQVSFVHSAKAACCQLLAQQEVVLRGRAW